MLCFVGYSNPDWEYLKLDQAPDYSILRIPFPAGRYQRWGHDVDIITYFGSVTFGPKRQADHSPSTHNLS